VEVSSLVELAKQVGPYFMILTFFVYRDYRREERQAGDINTLNQFVRTSLVRALNRNTRAIRDLMK
jgi:hypothetical protein